MYLQRHSKVVRILRSLKGKCCAKIIYYKFVIFPSVTFSVYSFVFISILLSSIFCYFCCIIFLFLCHLYKFFPANFFILLNHLNLPDCFPKFLYIIFNQTVCSQISYNVWQCLLLSFILFLSHFLYI